MHHAAGIARKGLITLIIALTFSFAVLSVSAAAGGGPEREFYLPAGDASDTVKQFASQAEREILYRTELLAGVRTVALQGLYTPREALERVLGGAELLVVEDAKTGALMILHPSSVDRPHAVSSSTEKPQTPEIPEKPMKRKSLIVLLSGLLSFGSAQDLSAQAGASSGPVPGGRVVGQVTDVNTGRFLPGAVVSIDAIERSAITDREGRFVIASVPQGVHTLVVRYIGYDEVVQSVQVPATGAVTVPVALGSEVVAMGEFVVGGYREGQSLALQQKRTAINNMDIISADSVGELPDRNVAEALSRIAGLSISQSAGEGQFVSIRGVEPNLNNVTFNGVTVAPPGVGGRSGRATQLDIIAASQISQVEVVKAVTPDMDANALGGTINIKTVSGFDRRERFIYGAVEGGQNRHSDKSVYGADFTYGNVFGENRTFGVAFAASYSKRNYLNDEIRGRWAVSDGVPFMQDLDMNPEMGVRERLGLNLNLEYRPDEDSQFYVRTIYNLFDQSFLQDAIRLEGRRDSPTFVTPTHVTFDRIRSEPKVFRGDSRQTLTNITVGGSRKFQNLTIELQATYSRGRESLPEFRGAQFRPGNILALPGELFSVDFTEFLPVYEHNDFLDRINLPFRRFRIDDSLVEEETWTPQIDLRWDFDGAFGGRNGFLKFGTKYTNRSRFVDDNSERPSTSAFNIVEMGALGPPRTFFGGRYTTPLTVDLDASLAFLEANRAAFPINELNSVQNSIEDDFDIGEEITAFYGMASVDVNPRLRIMGGVRYERTDAELVGWEVRQDSFNTDTGELLGEIVENRGEFKYDNFLPNAQFRYELSERSVLRGSYTKTIGRPAYEDASPISVFLVEPVLIDPNPDFPNTGSLEIGNPNLKPYESDNFDIAFEYYFDSGAVFNVGYFYKDIKNPVYDFSEVRHNTVHNGIAVERLSVSTTNNARSGEISGVEINFQLPFRTFTTGFFDGFGVNLNATFIDSKVTVFDREGEDLPFFRQPDRVYNATIYYEKHGLSARISYNHQDDSIRELGSSAMNDIYNGDRYFVDFQASYRFHRNYSAYFVWRNVTNQMDERWIGDKSRMNRATIYGSDMRVGVRFNF